MRSFHSQDSGVGEDDCKTVNIQKENKEKQEGERGKNGASSRSSVTDFKHFLRQRLKWKQTGAGSVTWAIMRRKI